MTKICQVLLRYKGDEFPHRGGLLAALVLQTNGWHWVLDETHAREARAVVGSLACIWFYLLRLIENVEKASDTSGSQLISTTNTTISKANQSSIDNGSPVLSVQPDTLLQLGNRCSGGMVDPDQWFDD